LFLFLNSFKQKTSPEGITSIIKIFFHKNFFIESLIEDERSGLGFMYFWIWESIYWRKLSSVLFQSKIISFSIQVRKWLL